MATSNRRTPVSARARALPRLALSASSLALVWAFAGAATAADQPAAAAAASADATAGSEIVVTGTRIRGVAPVGSTVVQLGQEEVKKAGLTSTADLVNSVPSILNLGAGNAYAGGSAQETDNLSSLAFGKSPNIRGFGPQATLSLVNGHRMAYEGANMNEFDGDNYPVQMLDRVEIVADGTSPIYGADAVSGTVNYILRQPVDTVEMYGGLGHADGQNTWQATGIVGKTWTGGGFIMSYQHTYQAALLAAARPKIYSDNFAPYGGAPSTDFSSPGNVIYLGQDYAIPAGQNGTALTLAQLGPAGTANRLNGWTGVDAIPQETADHFAINLNQDLTDWLQVFGDGLYTKRTFSTALYGRTVNQVTKVVPNSNPFSPCNNTMVGAPAALVAACATGSLTVHYNDVFDSGPNIRSGPTFTWAGTIGLHIKLPDEWKLSVSATDADHMERVFSNYNSGSPSPSATAFNFFCDGQAFTCNPATLTSTLAGVPTPGLALTQTDYRDQDYNANADGPLFHLPGGDVRLAVGAEYYTASFQNVNNVGAGVNVTDYRQITSGYAELYIPIVGAANAMPGIARLELDVAGRIDHYSDVGSTTNPKIGLNWSPIEDLKLHASYGTSFRAPGLADNDPTTQHIWLPATIAGSTISAGICSLCQPLPAASIYRVVGGANHDLQNEHSTSYSVGGDWNPKAIPGLSISANFWQVNYTGQVNTPVYNAGAAAAINQQIYNKFIIYNPTYFPTLAANNPLAFFGNFPNINLSNADCAAVYGKNVTTQALYNSLITCVNGGNDAGVAGAPQPPSNVLAVEDGHRLNSGSTLGQGVDLSGYYAFHSDIGSWRVGALAEYINRWDVAPFAGAPVVPEVNRYGYPLAFKTRAEFSWSQDYGFGGLAASLFVNYSNAYKMDIGLLPVGVAPSYANISSYTTADITLGYDTKTSLGPWIAKNVTVTFSVQNLFDTKPPLVLNGAGNGSVLFDPANASPLGRVVQLQIGKKW
jgi:iron complex outermembrane receptor protein